MHRVAPLALAALAALALPLALAACGDDPEEVPKEILGEEVYARRCESPRAEARYMDKGGSLLDEKLWIRSWLNDTYLWYRELPTDIDMRPFTDPVDYFDVMKTSAKTPSGKDKDRFHFIYPTPEWEALSQAGTEAGYGVQWALLASAPPRLLVVAFTQPGSPADGKVMRGTKVVTIDGVDVENSTGQANIDKLNAGISPAGLAETHSFGVIDPGGTTVRTVTLTSAKVDLVPVQGVGTLPAPNTDVGYILFTDHIATAERGLIDAINQLKTAGIHELVLDLRYNGGGYLDIASQLAYMIAGPDRTGGKAFESLTFNDKLGAPQRSSFATTTLGFSTTEGQPLPHLDLTRVFVLTGGGTCSASESVMNGLAGVDIDVVQIGTTTCGKPYGFVPAENCGTTYFAIQFQGVNNKGFGDYADGFVPGTSFHGCTVADDFTRQLGDPAEARLAAALAYRSAGACASVTARRTGDPLAAAPDGDLLKPLWRQNRIVR